jgi:hypothetical protein
MIKKLGVTLSFLEDYTLLAGVQENFTAPRSILFSPLQKERIKATTYSLIMLIVIHDDSL